MALSPKLKRMVSGARASSIHIEDPLDARRSEILAQHGEILSDWIEENPSVERKLAMLGLRKATKRELAGIIVDAMESGV